MTRVIQTALAHPAPHRDRRSMPMLLFGVCGAPAAWLVQLVLGYALAAYPCFPDDTAYARLPHSWWWDRGVLFAINLGALAVAILATLVARGSWRRTAQEGPGTHRELLELGEGRTRFMAACGVLTGLGFIAAILFNTVGLAGTPQCSG